MLSFEGEGEGFGGGGGHLDKRLSDGGDGGCQEGEERRVVERDDAEVFGDSDFERPGDVDEVEGDVGASADDGGGGGVSGEELGDVCGFLEGEDGGVLGEEGFIEPVGGSDLAEGGLEASDSVDGVGVGGAGSDESDSLVAESGEVVDGEEGSEDVVGIDGDGSVEGPA